MSWIFDKRIGILVIAASLALVLLNLTRQIPAISVHNTSRRGTTSVETNSVNLLEVQAIRISTNMDPTSLATALQQLGLTEMTISAETDVIVLPDNVEPTNLVAALEALGLTKDAIITINVPRGPDGPKRGPEKWKLPKAFCGIASYTLTLPWIDLLTLVSGNMQGPMQTVGASHYKGMVINKLPNGRVQIGQWFKASGGVYKINTTTVPMNKFTQLKSSRTNTGTNARSRVFYSEASTTGWTSLKKGTPTKDVMNAVYEKMGLTQRCP